MPSASNWPTARTVLKNDECYGQPQDLVLCRTGFSRGHLPAGGLFSTLLVQPEDLVLLGGELLIGEDAGFVQVR
jgi:hypothetical protein